MAIAHTRYGDIEGIKVSEKDKPEIYAFRGVPYAKPPSGELRFRPPQECEKWEGVKKCTEFGAPSLQLFRKNHVPQPYMLEISDEDCLYLNILTPRMPEDYESECCAEDTESLPVYIFIHGGGFESGGGNMPLYEGKHFAEKGIVYVSINYRLGVMGSLCLETLEKESGITGNYSVLDGAMAVKWVYENIAAFGGNPDNITVGGQSAGADMISVLMCMDSVKGMFRRCILESGAITGCQITDKFGCGNYISRIRDCRRFAEIMGADDSPGGVEKLRKASAEELTLKWSFGMEEPVFGNRSVPVLKGLISDEDVRPDSVIGKIHDVDLLFSFNTDEGSIFADPDLTEEGFDKIINFCFQQDSDEILSDSFFRKNCEKNGTISAGVNSKDCGTEFYRKLSEIIGMRCFKACALPYADELSSRGMNVYGCHFDYFTEWMRKSGMGCSHISELYFVFSELTERIGADNEEGRRISDFMNAAWTGFIKNGNPSSGSFRWEKYDASGENITRISNSGISCGRMERIDEIRYLMNKV